MKSVLVTMLTVAALVLPAAALAAGAQQIVETWENAPAAWELVDPCTGGELHGIGTESGEIRITDLGDNGHHLRLRATGEVELYDDAGVFVGTWSYAFVLADQYPPDGQGAVLVMSVGPLRYADGHRAVIQAQLHLVFEKGDVVRRVVEKSVCGG